jgi:hypothetical protein
MNGVEPVTARNLNPLNSRRIDFPDAAEPAKRQHPQILLEYHIATRDEHQCDEGREHDAEGERNRHRNDELSLRAPLETPPESTV